MVLELVQMAGMRRFLVVIEQETAASGQVVVMKLVFLGEVRKLVVVLGLQVEGMSLI